MNLSPEKELQKNSSRLKHVATLEAHVLSHFHLGFFVAEKASGLITNVVEQRLSN